LVTSVVSLRAFASSAGLPFAMLIDRKREYFPRLRPCAGGAAGTDGVRVNGSTNGPRNEMIFERVGPSCYLRGPFSVLLEQSASAGRSLDETPAEHMHRAVSRISQVHVEICGTAERIVASPPRELGHG
jgi:hypothetical protein